MSPSCSNICRFVFPAQSKKVCLFMSTFPMLACSAWSCCFYALCPVSEACNLIWRSAQHRSCTSPSTVPQGTLSNSYETYPPPTPRRCKSLVTAYRRWTAVCRLLKLTWHFLQWLLHIDKSLPRGHMGVIADITWECVKTTCQNPFVRVYLLCGRL